MDQILLGLGAAGAALLVIAITVALWEHRRHIAEMRQQLAWSENTRDLLQAHAQDVNARLATLSAAVQAQQQPQQQPPQQPVTPAELPARHITAHAGSAAVAMAAARSAPPQRWIDTEPMVLTSQVYEGPAQERRSPDFDPTMPAALSEH